MLRAVALCLFALLLMHCGSPRCDHGAACADDSSDGSVRHAAGDGSFADAGATAAHSDVVGRAGACVAQSLRAQHEKRPVDAIFVIDNSSSMTDEIAAVRASIDRDFAQLVDQSGVDLRVVLLSRFGAGGTDVCIEPPLAAAPCSAGLSATNSPHFFQYNQEINSNDALCQLLETLDHADADGRAPGGFQDWLRPEAQKAFVIFSDDQALCAYRERGVEVAFTGGDPVADALLFHQTLLAKAPNQFGVPPDVRYQFFSIVGLSPSATPGQPLFPSDPLQPNTCDTAPAAGLSYQELSIITDALRYPICEGRSFDTVFRALARSVVDSSSADCDFELPEDPKNQIIDPRTIDLVVHGSGNAAPLRLTQVLSSSACNDAGSFYIDGRIQLCPSACALVKRDAAPEIELLYGCDAVAQ